MKTVAHANILAENKTLKVENAQLCNALDLARAEDAVDDPVAAAFLYGVAGGPKGGLFPESSPTVSLLNPGEAFTQWAVDALAEQAKVKPEDPRSSALASAFAAQRTPDAYGR